MVYIIKTEIKNIKASKFEFVGQKTMYGGKQILKGDTIFLFASETEGGVGLIASGVVTFSEPIPLKAGVTRQTPRVSLHVKRTQLAKRRLGRDELKTFKNWSDEKPQTELNLT